MNSDRVSRVFNSRNILLDQLAHVGYDTKDYVGASIEEINNTGFLIEGKYGLELAFSQ